MLEEGRVLGIYASQVTLVALYFLNTRVLLSLCSVLSDREGIGIFGVRIWGKQREHGSASLWERAHN